jgi:hypothetical protein
MRGTPRLIRTAPASGSPATSLASGGALRRQSLIAGPGRPLHRASAACCGAIGRGRPRYTTVRYRLRRLAGGPPEEIPEDMAMALLVNNYTETAVPELLADLEAGHAVELRTGWLEADPSTGKRDGASR